MKVPSDELTPAQWLGLEPVEVAARDLVPDVIAESGQFHGVEWIDWTGNRPTRMPLTGGDRWFSVGGEGVDGGRLLFTTYRGSNLRVAAKVKLHRGKGLGGFAILLNNWVGVQFDPALAEHGAVVAKNHQSDRSVPGLFHPLPESFDWKAEHVVSLQTNGNGWYYVELDGQVIGSFYLPDFTTGHPGIRIWGGVTVDVNSFTVESVDPWTIPGVGKGRHAYLVSAAVTSFAGDGIPELARADTATTGFHGALADHVPGYTAIPSMFHGAAVTQGNLVHAANRAERLRTNDVFVLHISGYAVVLGSRVVLLPADATMDSLTPEALRRSGIFLDDLINAATKFGGRRLVFIDCSARLPEGAPRWLKPAFAKPSAAQKFIARWKQQKGLVLWVLTGEEAEAGMLTQALNALLEEDLAGVKFVAFGKRLAAALRKIAAPPDVKVTSTGADWNSGTPVFR